MKLAVILTAVLVSAAPLAAQTDPHQPYNDGSAAASQSVPPGSVAPGHDPGTRAANASVTASHQSHDAQHQADMAAYDSAVRAHGRQIMRQDARYARQQAAYADAMTTWRAQVAACNRGSRVACNAPAPDPASFY